jgi:hypothetical protein
MGQCICISPAKHLPKCFNHIATFQSDLVLISIFIRTYVGIVKTQVILTDWDIM